MLNFFMFLEVENAGKCIECNNPCYIESGKCYALSCVEGETHNCPDDDEGLYEQDIMCCDRCSADVLAKTKCMGVHVIRTQDMHTCLYLRSV